MNIFLHKIFNNMASDAISSERISRVVGYILKRGNFALSSSNLPQRVLMIGEANHAQQSTLDTTSTQITSAKQAGDKYGYGSPIHIMARIIYARSGSRIGGIPLFVHAQDEPGGATAKVLEITPTGVANNNGTHYVTVAGRNGLDGDTYAINVEAGDTEADLTAKISDAINNILGCPMTAVHDDYVVTATSKWRGKTANELSITIDTGNDDLGITYAVISLANGAGTPGISDALDSIGNAWVTLILNGYGTESDIMDAIEAFNGRPNDENPTGRFQGIIMKPLIAITGNIDDDPSAITDARPEDVTIALAPAPLSPGLSMEAAANMLCLWAPTAQNKPHLDVCGQYYPDMPTPKNDVIGSMASYDNRDVMVKKGCSTVDIKAGQYFVQDFVTTYHKEGENPPQFRYVRNLNIDFNIRYGYYLLEQINVVDKAIVDDNDLVSVGDIIKPKTWKQILADYFKDTAKRALTVQPEFSLNGLVVNISTVNPDRLETFFPYKRSGYARQAATTAEAGFNTGNLN